MMCQSLRYFKKLRDKLVALIIWLFVALLLSPHMGDIAFTADLKGLEPSSCFSESGERAVEICESVLNSHPKRVDIRLALSNALMRLGSYQEAVDILKKGLEFYPESKRIKKKLSLAENYLKEKLWIEKRQENKVKVSKTKVDAKTKLNIIRCVKLKGKIALKACNEGLKILPNNPSLHRGKGNIFLKMNRIGEAIFAYQKSLKVDPSNKETSQKLTEAQLKRGINIAKCQRLSGSSELERCNATLVIRASDE